MFQASMDAETIRQNLGSVSRKSAGSKGLKKVSGLLLFLLRYYYNCYHYYYYYH